jgi:predicted ATPase
MQITRIQLENWRNFLHIDLPLRRRMFLVGPNASGKSNLLDAVRFLRDIADQQGGFQAAVASRSGVSQIRSLHARRYPNVVVDLTLDLNGAGQWRYRLEFSQDNQRRPIVAKERAWRGDDLVLDRPLPDDEQDQSRLSQTHLEQVNANKDFRAISDFLAQIRYLHLVPQLVREPDRSVGKRRDPYGGDFLEQLAGTPRRVLDSRLKRIQEALRVAVPQLRELKLERDHRGVAHLKALYTHWRPNAGWQGEDQLSDGTLRLLGLLWGVLDGSAPLLLEEPELSLHAAVVRHIPAMIAGAARKGGRQVLVSTHSPSLLSDEGVALEEVALLQPTEQGTEVELASSRREMRALVESGVSVADAVLPRTAPVDAGQLALFGT